MGFKFRLFFTLLIIGGALIYYSGSDFLTFIQKPVDYHDLKVEDIKPGLKVEADIDILLDAFAEATNKENSSSSSKLSHQYYLVPVGENEFIALEGAASDIAALDKIVEDTAANLLAGGNTLGSAKEPFKFVGTIAKSDAQIFQFMKEYFVEMAGIEASEAERISLPYVLESRSYTAVCAIFGVGVLLVIIDLLYLILFFVKFRRPRVS